MNEKSENMFYRLVTYFVGGVFIGVGLYHLRKFDTAISDMLNLWSFLFIMGSFIIYLLKTNGKIVFATLTEKLNKNSKIAIILENLVWFVISLVLAYWLTQNTGLPLIGLNTNGFSIMAMGIACLMIYHSN